LSGRKTRPDDFFGFELRALCARGIQTSGERRMPGINGGFIAVQALLICALLYFFARHEADYSFSTVILVVCGVIFGNFMLAVLLFPKIGFFVAVPIYLFTSWMLVQFCWVSWPKGLLVTFVYFTLAAGFEIGKICVQTGHFVWDIAAQTTANTPENNYDKSVQEGMAVFNDLQKSTARMNAGQGTNRSHTMPSSPTNVILPETSQHVATSPNAPAVAAAAKPSATPPVSAINADWAMAKSALRIRGWMNGHDGGREAVVNDQTVPVGGTTYVDYKGVRYTWKLAALDGYSPRWEPVDAVPLAK
jgi:hypothetical protein